MGRLGAGSGLDADHRRRSSRACSRSSTFALRRSASTTRGAPFTTLFAYQSTGYEAVTVGAIALFGWLLERRHGWWAPLLVFFVCGAGGAYVAVEIAGEGIALGANGAALGMLAAWTMRDVLGRRKGIEDDSDLLGVLAIAAVLVLLPLATTDASGVAGVVGGVVGMLLGLLLARLPER